MDDDEIRLLVASLSRPHGSGGDVIERAAILASGAHSAEVVGWIVSHHGKPEVAVAAASTRGLHGSRFTGEISSEARPPLRYVLPPGTLA
ncbi:MAG TPA: hypothetical protein VH300_13110 [Thermoleophilaceae bacterium]|nr:hypothetical protein [Thermoleophilaceae bacterium]